MLQSPLAKELLEDRLPDVRRAIDALKLVGKHEIQQRVNTIPGLETLVENEVVELFEGLAEDVYARLVEWTK